jgi:hypothetical protein
MAPASFALWSSPESANEVIAMIGVWTVAASARACASHGTCVEAMQYRAMSGSKSRRASAIFTVRRANDRAKRWR